MRICAQEESSHDTRNIFVRPQKLRLHEQLRSKKLKVDMAHPSEAADSVLGMMQVLEERAMTD
eukprot:3926787-Pleurochrysis_carterae.AAC.4